ncbi:hypothetical protein HCZ22_09445 [Limosilactobacillus fermentum]|uniref:hypothetical protein n=1 Tax=Limosilactobacillus fermentum TaxID=1613 RepID=UPI0013A63F4B|nr:hypothetical protein [Limosilactobacillus fermentum]QWQ33861.1 hypothetical protein KOM17_01320 [Limosilactobacillus fermentum]GIC73251.1 hypothetical protein LFLT20_02550 [Limosilactobacillus fermentum]
MELDNSIHQMITKDLVQKMITSMGGQSKSSISNIDLKTLTVLEQLYRELNFRPVSWATSLAHGNRKKDLIDELIRLLGYQSVMSFCN